MADVYELAGASRSTSEEIAAEVGQTAARWHVMSALSAESFTVPAIARRLGLTRQSVQRVVNDLEGAGLVRLEPNPDHVRSPLVTLTAEGAHRLLELFQRSEASRTALLERARVSADELLEARKAIRALVSSFDDRGPAGLPGRFRGNAGRP